METRLIIVGGFLGAGKTTLLWESARKLSDQGTKAGLITNDQAAELVDTAFLEYGNSTVEEVSGSCFCCNFNGFSAALSKLSEEERCSLIIAEPVGSCTDLSATIVQPLKDKFREELVVAPFTVLVDPERLDDILCGRTSGLHESASYILRKQLEEADIILISKTDLLDARKLEILQEKACREWPLARIMSASVKNGTGLKEWLETVMSLDESGTHLAEVDYDTYAEGEAVLGWYNASFRLTAEGTDWDSFLITLMKGLSERFDRMNASVGHLKMLIREGDEHMIGNITGTGKTLSVRGSLKKGNEAKLTINARVQMDPEELERLIAEMMGAACAGQIRFESLASKCLSPGRPNPTYRYDHVI